LVYLKKILAWDSSGGKKFFSNKPFIKFLKMKKKKEFLGLTFIYKS